MIKTFAPIFILACLVALSCKKNNTGCAFTFVSAPVSDSEVVATRDSLNAHSISGFSAAPSGFFYNIIDEGTGDTATSACSQVVMTYTGKLLDDSTFDSTAPNEMAAVTLGQLIAGLQKAIPMIRAGGEIIAYIPPTLGYGTKVLYDSNRSILIPSKSILIFDVKLISVKNP